MATIIDVAKRAGVSTATVSRVLNDSSKVSAQTRTRILEAIDELQYNPNALGRNLRRMRSGLVLVILPAISNSFFSQVVKGMEETGAAQSYTTMICTTRSDPERERMFLNLVRNRQADGVILLSSCLPPVELKRFGAEYPIVQCNEAPAGEDIPIVSIDNVQAGYDAARHLLALGHRRIGVIAAHGPQSSALRLEGFRRALRECGIDDCPIAYGNFTYQTTYAVAEQFLSHHPQLTALFAFSDVMACAAVRAAQDMGRRVPEDLSVIGCDNITLSRAVRPALTTIAQPRYDLGSAAMKMLSEQIENGSSSHNRIYLEHTIIKRESTAKPNQKKECIIP